MCFTIVIFFHTLHYKYITLHTLHTLHTIRYIHYLYILLSVLWILLSNQPAWLIKMDVDHNNDDGWDRCSLG